MIVIKWISFILVCLDTLSYMIDGTKKEGTASFVGLCIGSAARAYVLCNTVIYWLLA